jgi:hypothetical protein
MTHDLQYPIGRLELRQGLGPADRARLIDQIAEMPARFRAAVEGLSDARLDTPYREGGWTVRQVVHHVPDSHLNAFCRFRLALTEAHPTVRPYNEKSWADLPDMRMPPEVSLRLLESLHERWVYMLRALPETAWARTYHHPEAQRDFILDDLLQIYAHHGRHHTAHITGLRARMEW